MGNKHTQQAASPWATVAKAAQDVRSTPAADARGLTPDSHAAPVINTTTAKLPANIVWSSLKWTKSNESLQFDFIASEDCSLIIKVDGVIVKDKVLTFPKGKQTFLGNLELKPENTLVIILCEQQQQDGSCEGQRSLNVICRLKGDRLILLSKQVHIEGKTVDLEEVYGIGSGRECVICISEIPNTTLLPCRHMCACEDCASYLMRMAPAERKCPVCRSLVASTVKVNTGGGQ